MPHALPRLIVNADDFGYTAGVNRAIIELHHAGALRSATLMARGAALEDGLARLPSLSRTSCAPGALGIGCHVVLVDGTPVLSAEELPTLACVAQVFDQDQAARRASGSQAKEVGVPKASALHSGNFRPALGSFVADLLRGRIFEEEIEREAIAQIRLLQLRGVHVTHLDTHKHTHMFARVLRPLLRAALQCGVKAIRNPFEPEWSIDATSHAPLLRRAEVRMLALLRPEFQKLVAQAGLRTTDGAIGVLATGTLDASTLRQLLQAALREADASAANPTWELVCHPGYHDAELDAQPTRLTAARETERMALAAVAPNGLNGFNLTHFGQLVG